jgi:hypothetical protein
LAGATVTPVAGGVVAGAPNPDNISSKQFA